LARRAIPGVQDNAPFFFELYVTETLFVLRWFRCLNFTQFDLWFRLTLWVGPRSNGLVVKGFAFRVEYLEPVVFHIFAPYSSASEWKCQAVGLFCGRLDNWCYNLFFDGLHFRYLSHCF